MVWGRNTVMPMKAVHPHPREKADDESVQIDEYVADLHKNFSKLINLPGNIHNKICCIKREIII